MDLTMIDVTDHDAVAVRDEVVVLGAQQGPLGQRRHHRHRIALHTGTIAWDILTSVSRACSPLLSRAVDTSPRPSIRRDL